MSFKCNHRSLVKLNEPVGKIKRSRINEKGEAVYERNDELRYAHRCMNCGMHIEEKRADGIMRRAIERRKKHELEKAKKMENKDEV